MQAKFLRPGSSRGDEAVFARLSLGPRASGPKWTIAGGTPAVPGRTLALLPPCFLPSGAKPSPFSLMRPRLSRLAALAALLTPVLHAWDYEGHRIVNQLAISALPKEYPSF